MKSEKFGRNGQMNILIAAIAPDDTRELSQILAPYSELTLKEVQLPAGEVFDRAAVFGAMEEPHVVLAKVQKASAGGTAFIRALRGDEDLKSAGLIIYSKGGESEDKAQLLEAGADDVVSCPISPAELRARVLALARRLAYGTDATTEDEDIIKVGPLRIYTSSFRVFVEDQPISLTLTEFRILEVLARKAGGVVKREDLLALALKTPRVSTRTIDVHITSLRKKLERPNLKIETVRSLGYRLQIES